MNKNERKWGVIFQYLNIFATIILSLVYTPIVLRVLGQNEYGLYNLSASIVSYLYLLSLGLNSSYLRFYSISKKNKTKNDIPHLNGLYLIVFLIIGIIALIIGLSLSFNVTIFLNKSYSIEEIKIAKWLMIILTINVSISFPGTVFSSYITSHEKFFFLKLMNLISTVLTPCLSLVFLFTGFRSIGIAVSTTVFSLITIILNILFSFKKVKIKFSFKNIDYSIFKDILVFSLFIAANQIIDMLNWETDKIILAKMIGGSSVAIYSIGSHFNNFFILFSTSISNVFSPQINEIMQSDMKDKDEKLSNLFIKVGRIQWFVIFLILSGFIFYGKFFISKWAGAGYENSYIIAIMLISPLTIDLIQNVGIEIQRAKNKHYIRSIVFLIIALLNVGISIILAKYYGEIGCAFGTMITMILGPGIFMNIYYQTKLNINIKKFWLEILKTIPSFIPALLFGTFSCVFHKFNSFVDFTIMCFIYTILYSIFAYLFGLNKYEKSLIQNILCKFRIKRASK